VTSEAGHRSIFARCLVAGQSPFVTTWTTTSSNVTVFYHWSSNQRDHRLGRQYHSHSPLGGNQHLLAPHVCNLWLAQRVDIRRVSLELQFNDSSFQIVAGRHRQLGRRFPRRPKLCKWFVVFFGCSNMQVSAPPRLLSSISPSLFELTLWP